MKALGRLAVGLLAMGWAIGHAAAQAQPDLSDADRQAIRQVVESQLAAFRADDADKAYSFASPSIQAQFGTAGNFMAMVIASYQPVYRPKAVFFKDVAKINGMVVQRVLLIDQDDDSVLALYPMELQGDGSWRINGCFLKAAEEKLM